MQLYTKILIGMFIGVVLGLLIGPNSSILPQDSVRLSSGVTVYEAQNGAVTKNFKGIKTAKIIKEDSDWIEIGFQLSAADQLRLKSEGVTLKDKSGNPIEPGTTVEAWVKDEQPDVRRYAGIGQMLVDNTEWLGQLFLAMIKMVVVPLVFFSLVVGIASLGDVRKLGRMGGRTLGFFMMTTVVALSIGVGLANLIKPGKMLSDADRDNLLASYSDGASSSVANAAEAPSFLDQIVSIVPSNPIGALAGGDMLQVIFFAMMLGIALTFLKDDRADLVVDVFDRLNDAMVMLCLLYTSPSPRDISGSRMPSSA